MRRTGNISLVPTIGSIGWATLKTVAEPRPLGPPADAQPAGAATAAALPEVNAFLRSMISVSCSRCFGAEAPCYIRAHAFTHLVLCLFCVLVPLGGWRGRRVDKQAHT